MDNNANYNTYFFRWCRPQQIDRIPAAITAKIIL